MDQKQGTLLRLYFCLAVGISGSFSAAGAILATALQGGVRSDDMGWLVFFIVFATIAYAIPALLVVVGFRIFWGLKQSSGRDQWLLGFTFAAVQAPMIYVMSAWLVALISALLNKETVASEAMYGVWVIPIAWLPITAPIGLALGFFASRLASGKRAFT